MGSGLPLPAGDSLEVIVESTLADIELQACVVVALLFLRPHVLDKDRLAVCDAFSLLVGQRRAVYLCRKGYPADRYMVELVSLGIERYQTWLTHALGQFEFHHAPRIAFFL